MAGLEVILMPANGEVFAIYHFVHHTWIIWVQLKAVAEQCFSQFAIKEHGSD